MDYDYIPISNLDMILDFDKFIESNLDEDSNILDIGFGTGKFLYRLFHRHGIKNVSGIDISKKEK